MMLFSALKWVSARLFLASAVLTLLVLSLGATADDANRIPADNTKLTVYLFWQSGCPYCSEAREEIQNTFGASEKIYVRLLEIGRDRSVDELFEGTLDYFGFPQGGVPLVVIGDGALMGFSSDGRSRAAYMELVARCEQKPCRDIIAELAGQNTAGTTAVPPTDSAPRPVTSIPPTISVPVFGVLDAGSLPLAVVTILLAAIDGFNPCAMWVLVFLIGLLIGLENRQRRWALGGVFLATTAILYFAVIAAWFNVVTFVGAASWLRYGVGVLALWVGFYFLREYWTKQEATCHVTSPGRRQRIMAAFRAAATQNSFLLAALGIAVLAILVNLIELACSAGVPAVFTQILALNTHSSLQSYAYVLLYVIVFILDDIAIFAAGMIALEVTGLTGRYAHLSHLLGGCMLLAIGALLILRPDLLAFN